jgi:hypothetical protein
MARDAPTVFSTALGVAVMTASVETGQLPQEVCAALGLSPDEVKDPLGRFPHADFVRAWEALDERIHGFGFRAARLVRTPPLSLAEFAISNASTAEEAFRVYVRFQAMFHDAAGPARAA